MQTVFRASPEPRMFIALKCVHSASACYRRELVVESTLSYVPSHPHATDLFALQTGAKEPSSHHDYLILSRSDSTLVRLVFCFCSFRAPLFFVQDCTVLRRLRKR